MAGGSLKKDIENLLSLDQGFRDGDPEEYEGFGADALQAVKNDELIDEVNGEPTRRASESRLSFRPDIVLEGPEYEGKKSSRTELLGEEDSSHGFPLNDEDGDHKHVKSTAEKQEDDEETDEDIPSVGIDMVVDEAMEALDREYVQLRQEEEEVLKSVKPRLDEDRLKGKAIEQQKAFWDKALEFRISLQKPLQMGYRLPEPSVAAAMATSSPQVQKAISDFSMASKLLLNLFLQIQEEIVVDNPAVNKPNLEEKKNENGKRERESIKQATVDVLWKEMDDWHKSFSPFLQSAVDRWHRKTQLSASAQSLVAQRAKLRALDQSISQQVKSALDNSTRFVERTRLRSGLYHKIGERKPENENDVEEDEELEKKIDLESYDDSEFYQQLLREFLEASDPGGFESLSLRKLRKLRNSKKKVVDHRASKERKIRYVVVPQLVNFMAPEQREIPSVALKLFGSLFGEKRGEE